MTVGAITVTAQALSSRKRHDEPAKEWGLLPGHQWGLPTGHRWGLSHGHGQRKPLDRLACSTQGFLFGFPREARQNAPDVSRGLSAAPPSGCHRGRSPNAGPLGSQRSWVPLQAPALPGAVQTPAAERLISPGRSDERPHTAPNRCGGLVLRRGTLGRPRSTPGASAQRLRLGLAAGALFLGPDGLTSTASVSGAGLLSTRGLWPQLDRDRRSPCQRHDAHDTRSTAAVTVGVWAAGAKRTVAIPKSA